MIKPLLEVWKAEGKQDLFSGYSDVSNHQQLKKKNS